MPETAEHSPALTPVSQGRSSYLSEPEANDPTTRMVHPSASESSRQFPDRQADDPLPFFPRNGPGEILITSRNFDWAGIARPLELELAEKLGDPPLDGITPHGCSPHWTRTTPNPAEWPGKRWSAPMLNLARLVKSRIARKGEPVAGRRSGNHLIVVADVEGFGERWRTGPDQRAVRDGLYGVMEAAFAATGTAWNDCYREDRGDGLLVLVPRDVDKAAFIEAALPVLVTRLRVHNHIHPEAQRIRLRIALHAGEVRYDEHGVSSFSVTLTFRLCEAPPLKAALAASPGVLVVIASGWLFDDVVRHAPGAAPATWRPVRVEVKETATTGWVTRPDHPYQAAPDPGSIGQPDSA